jgi:uncharacterized MAPEG superfamily protein
MQIPQPISIPFWGLCVFIVWTMLIVIFLIAMRLRHLRMGGSPADFGDPTDNKLLWRLWRSQANCTENLPLYTGAILLLTVRGVANSAVDALAIVYISSRLLHSLIHITNLNPILRVACLGIQFACLISILIYGIN